MYYLSHILYALHKNISIQYYDILTLTNDHI